MFFVKVYIKLVCVKDDLINDFKILEDIMGIFLENDFWTPPPLLSILCMDLTESVNLT